MKRPLASVALPFVLACLGSCKSGEPVSSGDRGVTAIQFQDVVVPTGMRLLDNNNESHSVEETGWRYGHFVYLGLPRLQDATAYLLERMPQHAWSLATDESPDQFTRRLKFVRGRYSADYTLRRHEGITHMVVEYKTDAQIR